MYNVFLRVVRFLYKDWSMCLSVMFCCFDCRVVTHKVCYDILNHNEKTNNWNVIGNINAEN